MSGNGSTQYNFFNNGNALPYPDTHGTMRSQFGSNQLQPVSQPLSFSFLGGSTRKRKGKGKGKGKGKSKKRHLKRKSIRRHLKRIKGI
jgi:hypothetical protein